METEFAEEPLREVTKREAESTLEMGYKDHILTRLNLRREFVAWDPAFDPIRDPPRTPEPVNFFLGDVRALPGGSGRSLPHLFLAVLDGGRSLRRHWGGVLGEANGARACR